jgi:hypothetical protein
MTKLPVTKLLRLTASMLVFFQIALFASTEISRNYALVFNTTGNLEESCSAEVRKNNTWMVPDGTAITFDMNQYLNTPSPIIRLVLNTNRYNATYRISFTFRDLKNAGGEILPYTMYLERGSAPLGNVSCGDSDNRDSASISINFDTATAGSGISTYEAATLLMALNEADVITATAGEYSATITFQLESI